MRTLPLWPKAVHCPATAAHPSTSPRCCITAAAKVRTDPPHLFNDFFVVLHAPTLTSWCEDTSHHPRPLARTSARSPRLTCCRCPSPHQLAPQLCCATSPLILEGRLPRLLRPTADARTRILTLTRQCARACPQDGRAHKSAAKRCGGGDESENGREQKEPSAHSSLTSPSRLRVESDDHDSTRNRASRNRLW